MTKPCAPTWKRWKPSSGAGWAGRARTRPCMAFRYTIYTPTSPTIPSRSPAPQDSPGHRPVVRAGARREPERKLSSAGPPLARGRITDKELHYVSWRLPGGGPVRQRGRIRHLRRRWSASAHRPGRDLRPPAPAPELYYLCGASASLSSTRSTGCPTWPRPQATTPGSPRRNRLGALPGQRGRLPGVYRRSGKRLRSPPSACTTSG
jgi:hypothetical protein